MKLHEPIINDFGGAPVAEHDYACPVLPNEHAVLDLNSAIFHPSWAAQRDGFVLLRVKWAPLRRLLKRWFPPSRR